MAVNLWKEQQMKYLNIPLVLLLALALASGSLSGTAAAHAGLTQNQSTALERGYRTGYSDGFSAGSQDVAEHAARDYRSKVDYQHGDRNYNQAWGTAADYRDGYQQGFEAGYNSGFDGRPFDSSIPSGFGRRAPADAAPVNNTPDSDQPANQGAPQSVPNNTNSSSSGPASGPLAIPRDAILTVELESRLSTDTSQRGDRFQARVVEPREFAGAIVEGRVNQVKRSGKVKGTAQLQLSFETIRLDNRTSGFSAEVIEVVDMGSRNGEVKADSEGGIKAKGSTKDDVSKVGASAGIGAIIGAVFGGGQGAAVGAAIGGAVGTGSVLSKRGKDVRLDRGQQLKIRTATETRIE
jgi:hypothetical protein